MEAMAGVTRPSLWVVSLQKELRVMDKQPQTSSMWHLGLLEQRPELAEFSP